MPLFLALALAAQIITPAAPASADPPKVSPVNVVGKPPAARLDPDRTVCRSNMSTGHHIADRACHTQGEWDRMEAAGKAYVGALQAQQSAGLPAGPR